MSDRSRRRSSRQGAESLLLLSLALQGMLLLQAAGRPGEWLAILLIILLGIWAWIDYPPGAWPMLVRTGGVLSFALILAAANGGGTSPFAIWLLPIVGVYSLLLPFRLARFLPAIVTLLYLSLVLLPDGPTSWSKVIGSALIIAALGASVLLLRRLWEREHVLPERDQLPNKRAYQLKALDSLTRGTTHDFNNLLTAVSGQIELAKASVSPSDPAHEYLEHAADATEQAIALSRRLRLSSGHVALDMRAIALNTFLNAEAEDWPSQLPANIALHLDTSDGLPPVQADPEALSILMQELLTIGRANIDHDAGLLTIMTGLRKLSKEDAGFARYTGHGLGPGEFVTLTVRDNGKSLSAEELDHLFEPYLSPRVHGLGPALVLGIVRAHRGSILAVSKPERGNSVTCLLPAYLGKAAQSVAADEPVPAAQLSRLRLILLFSADTSLRDRLEQSLGMEQVRVMVATDGVRGMALYDEFAASVAAVVLDLDVAGPALIAELAAQNPVLPIIAIGQVDAAAQTGPQPAVFLPHSIELPELVTQVRTLAASL